MKQLNKVQGLVEKMNLWGIQMKLRLQEEMGRTIKEEQGDIGIKQLAITVGVIVIVGAAVIALKDNIGDILTDVWDWLFETIQDMVA